MSRYRDVTVVDVLRGARRRLRPAAAVAAVLTLLATVPASGDVRSDLAAARARLGELQSRIEAREAVVDGLSARLGEQQDRVGEAEAAFGAVRRELGGVQRRLLATETELADLQGRISARARELYMHGTGGFLDFVLGSRSVMDVGERVGYVARLLREDSAVVRRAERTEAALEAEQAVREDLLRREAEQLKAVRAEERALERVFARQQSELDALASARAETLRLVESLRGKLAASELGPAIRAAGRGMPITFGEWAPHFLRALGAPVSRNNLVVVVAWQTAEYTKATWNPLATTMRMPGATVMNSHGVKNYLSLEQGVEASVKTLMRPGHRYEEVVASFRADADPMTTAWAINASDWCRGCTGGRYLVKLIPAVEANYGRYAN